MVNAHRVNQGEMPILAADDPASDFFFIEKDEPPVIQPSLEDLLRPETEDEDALSLADFDDEQ